MWVEDLTKRVGKGVGSFAYKPETCPAVFVNCLRNCFG